MTAVWILLFVCTSSLPSCSQGDVSVANQSYTSSEECYADSAKRARGRCQRKHPAEILALGPSCASHRRSSNANSLCGRNSAGSPKSVRPLKGIFCDGISEFESYMASQAVPSLSASGMKGSQSVWAFEPPAGGLFR